MSVDSSSSKVPSPAKREWPGLATPPDSPFRAAVARRLFLHAVRRLPIAVELPDGRRFGGGGPDAPVMRLVEPANFFHRLGSDGTIGLGEAYMVGDWTSDSLVEVLTSFASRMDDLVPRPLRAFRQLARPHKPSGEQNTVDGARRNIERHYDLSNELFALFL
ncbi:MAG: cyclopropane-fatty-acyl-phospholipid synthase, partial [Actinophytocola sp.]